MIALSVNDISLEYGTEVILNKINFSINEGDRLGVVGVNGAGKSTLLKIICGNINPSSGNVYIGKGKSISMLEQNAMLDSELSVFEEMLAAFPEQVMLEKKIAEAEEKIHSGENSDKIIEEYTSLTERFKDVGGYEYRGRIKSMLLRFGFPENMHTLSIKSLSGGERTRLSLIRHLLSEPDILILDEPTVAVDPQSRNKILEGILQLNREGATIIYTSHYMEEVEQICTRIAIMDKGSKIAEGTTEELKRMIKNTETITAEILQLPENVREQIEALEHVYNVSYADNKLVARCTGGRHNLIEILKILQENQVGFGSVYSEQPTLNDVFLEITGKALRDKE